MSETSEIEPESEPEGEFEDDGVEAAYQEILQATGEDDAEASLSMDWGERAEWLEALVSAYSEFRHDCEAVDARNDVLVEIRRILHEVR